MEVRCGELCPSLTYDMRILDSQWRQHLRRPTVECQPAMNHTDTRIPPTLLWAHVRGPDSLPTHPTHPTKGQLTAVKRFTIFGISSKTDRRPALGVTLVWTNSQLKNGGKKKDKSSLTKLSKESEKQTFPVRKYHFICVCFPLFLWSEPSYGNY